MREISFATCISLANFTKVLIAEDKQNSCYYELVSINIEIAASRAVQLTWNMFSDKINLGLHTLDDFLLGHSFMERTKTNLEAIWSQGKNIIQKNVLDWHLKDTLEGFAWQRAILSDKLYIFIQTKKWW